MPYERTSRRPQSLREAVVDDLRRADLKRTVHRDLRDLYAFYLDEDARERLAAKNWFKRWILTFGWLARALVLHLSPPRRFLLLLSVVLAMVGEIRFESDGHQIGFDTTLLGFLLLLVVLLLELKDKLLARDELEVGRAVQRSLLPTRMPEVPGWDIHVFTRPANDVGGDLVDYLPVDGGRTALVLGDVAGKGLGAALLMAKLQATLRAIAGGSGSLAELGDRMHTIFWRDQVPGRFATLVYAEIAPGSGRVRLLNAGHLPPVIVRRHTIEPREPLSPPLGLLPEAVFREETVDLEPGETMVIFSDGITEARNREGEFFGEDRLLTLLPELRPRSAGAGVERIVSEVARFVGEEPYADDVSLVVLRRAD